MSKHFYFGDNSSNSSDDDLSSLPYPKPLKRSDFLAPNFSATEYLSTLQNRHQTLEDLRTELRTRSQDLNKELLDLVNHNYQDFLGLGSSLKGGDERVEEIRLGLLGFRREVAALKGKVGERRGEVEELIAERKSVRESIQTGRQLLELEKRIGELEQRLLLTPKPQKEGQNEKNGHVEGDGDGNDDDDESEDTDSGSDSEIDADEDAVDVSVRKLRKRVEQLLLIEHLAGRLGPDAPFVARQEGRISRIRNTLILDLKNTLKSSISAGEAQRDNQLALLDLHRSIGEPGEAMKVVKESKAANGF